MHIFDRLVCIKIIFLIGWYALKSSIFNYFLKFRQGPDCQLKIQFYEKYVICVFLVVVFILFCMMAYGTNTSLMLSQNSDTFSVET